MTRPPGDGKVWFEEGLSFTCTQCGACCTGAPGYVWVDDAEVAALARRLGMEEASFRAAYTRPEEEGISLNEKPNNDCIFYDAAVGCTVYEDRPRQCRTWPFWDSTIRTRSAWRRTCEVCPGAGSGRLYTVEEILRARQVVEV